MRKGLRNIADKNIIFKFEGFLLDSKTGSASLINKKQIQFFEQVWDFYLLRPNAF